MPNFGSSLGGKRGFSYRACFDRGEGKRVARLFPLGTAKIVPSKSGKSDLLYVKKGVSVRFK